MPEFALHENTPSGTRYRRVSRDDRDQRDEWEKHVYSNESLIIEINGLPLDEALPEGTGRGRWTSSSTMPGLIARMIKAVDLSESTRVLEIGTGSGYNPAVLSHLIGSEHLTSIDVSPKLVSRATARLKSLGHTPTTATFDGHKGYPEAAPYDRIIGTTAFPFVPPAWLGQVNEGGVILTNLAGMASGAMLKLHTGPDGAEGRFLDDWAGFIPARHESQPEKTEIDDEEGDTHTSFLGAEVFDDQKSAFLAQLVLGTSRVARILRKDGSPLLLIEDRDGSRAEVETESDGEGFPCSQVGPRRLWSDLEDSYRWWVEQGRPSWSSFGMTVTPDEQYVWHESPTSGRRWRLTPTA